MSDLKKMTKDAAVLLIITVAAGFILGFVYQITKEPIAIAKEKAANEAYAEVFSNADSFEEISFDKPTDNTWKTEYSSVDIDAVLAAKDSSGASLGYVLTVTSHEGYGGDITFTMGVQNDGTLNGISILSISETAGLGMKAEDVLKPQFKNKNVTSFTFTKTGAAADNEIDAISGATITTNALTTAVNGGLYLFQTQLGGALE